MLVTIGIPFTNNKSTIVHAVQSVFAQSYPHWELILVDDGSTDGSWDVVSSIADPRVTVLRDGRNCGLAYRLNEITERARGHYIARMDADDIMHPDRLRRQVQYLQGNPGIDVVGTAAYTIDHRNRVLGLRGAEPINVEPKAVIQQGLFIHPTIMARREWFLTRPYNVHFRRAQDLELWCRTCAVDRFAQIREPLMFYRDEGPSSVRKYVTSQYYVRQIYKRFGPEMVGSLSTYMLILRTYMKTVAYMSLAAVGLEKRVVHARNTPLADYERERAENTLRMILATDVPGWDDMAFRP